MTEGTSRSGNLLGRVLTWKGHKGIFWSVGNIVYTYKDPLSCSLKIKALTYFTVFFVHGSKVNCNIKYLEQCQVHSKYSAIIIYSYLLVIYPFQRVYRISWEPKYSIMVQELSNTVRILTRRQAVWGDLLTSSSHPSGSIVMA